MWTARDVFDDVCRLRRPALDPAHEHGARRRRREPDAALPLRRISDQVYRGAFDRIIPIQSNVIDYLQLVPVVV